MEISKKFDVNKQITIKEKLSFFIVNFGNIPIMTLISGFLLIFYTDVVHLDPGAIAIIFLITRIFDSVNDPVMGYIVDHLPKTKWGRFRPYIVIGSIICAINYIALWLGPGFATSGKLLIVLITYIFLGITFDLMDIPLNTMIPVMSITGKTRDTLSLIKSMGYTFGSIVFYVITIPIVSSFGSPLIGYTILIIFTSITVVVCTFIGTLGIRERIEPIKKERYKPREFFRVLSAKPVFTHFIANLFISSSNGAAMAAMIYFLTYLVENPGLVGLFAFIIVLGNIIGFFIGKPILNKYGKKYTMVIGMLISKITILFILMVNPKDILLLVLILITSSLGDGFIMIVGYGLQADNTDYVEWKQGNRAEGAIASLISLVSKAGMGIGAALVGFILAITGYVPNLPQSPSAIQGIYLAYVGIPSILGIIAAAIIFFYYPLTKKKNAKIALALQEKRKSLD